MRCNVCNQIIIHCPFLSFFGFGRHVRNNESQFGENETENVEQEREREIKRKREREREKERERERE